MSSARHRVPKNVRSHVVRRDATPNDSGEPKLVDRGDMQLYSFHEPALVAGTYTITPTQAVKIPLADRTEKHTLQGTIDFPTSQQFEVIAPQFAIDPKDIHSVYPPQGHADQPSVLPHIIFNDSHLPWERELYKTTNNGLQNRVPWLATIPFDCNGPQAIPELRLSEAQLNGAGAVYTNSLKSTVTQSSQFSIEMTVKEYFQLNSSNPKVRIPPFSTKDKDFSEIKDHGTLVQVIFLNTTLFKQLFVRNNQVDLTQYQYVSHVRNINTQGMADSGVEDTGLFSVVHSLRTGPTDIEPGRAPRSQTVHVITLEYLDEIDIPGDDELVALISLHAWTYLCQPPLSVNFVDSMRAIGEQVKVNSCMLRCSDEVVEALSATSTTDPLEKMPTDPSMDVIRKSMQARAKAGYTLLRHRMASGEVSVSCVRSPLAPETVRRTKQIEGWPASSNNGQDYLIFDKTLSIMDVTYSTAWQLGKALASSDMGFVAALMRIRADAHSAGAVFADAVMVNSTDNVSTKSQVLQNLSDHTNTMDVLSSIAIPSPSPDLRSRWSQTKTFSHEGRTSARVPNEAKWVAAFTKGVHNRLSVTTSANDSSEPHGDTTAPKSSDWALVQDWIMEKLFLDAIPYHYLIVDPSHLPPESIRFFHVDPIWMDCLIDGALSVANHLARDDDTVRLLIKTRLNAYLKHVPSEGSHAPQVPLYGFFLRSAIVHVFPDLRIDVPFPKTVPSNGRLHVILQKNVRKDTVLCLLDRLPDNGEIETIRICQPPHQQRFSAGDYLSKNHIEFLFRKVYKDNTGKSDVLHEFGESHSWYRDAITSDLLKKDDTTLGNGVVYDWDSRCLDFDTLARNFFNTITWNDSEPSGAVSTNSPNEMGKEWGSTFTSAIAGIELNDTLKYLEFIPSKIAQPFEAELNIPRQIYLGPEMTSMATSSEGNFQEKEATRVRKTLSRISNMAKPSITPSPLPQVPQTLPRQAPRVPCKVLPRGQSTLPSHLNRLEQALPTSRPDPHSRIAVPPGMKQPQFDYAIFPSTTPFSRSFYGKGFISTSTPYAPDLIFAVNLRPPGSIISALMVHEIQFRIPIRDPSLRKNKLTDIIGGLGLIPSGDASVGSGARMLSNQRWVVHMDPQPAYLVLRLIPRSTKMTVPLLENRSLSFRLNEVEVAGADGSQNQEGEVTIGVKEIYGQWLDDAHTQWADMGSAVTTLRPVRTKKDSWP